MNKKGLKFAIAFLLIALVMVTSGCDIFGKKYTIEVKSYVSGTWVYIEYRESGTTEWTGADLKDIDGDTVLFLLYNDSTYPDTAYFDVPGLGTYDFRAEDILGGLEGAGEILGGVVEFDNMGMDSAHSLTISDLASIHGFN